MLPMLFVRYNCSPCKSLLKMSCVLFVVCALLIQVCWHFSTCIVLCRCVLTCIYDRSFWAAAGSGIIDDLSVGPRLNMLYSHSHSNITCSRHNNFCSNITCSRHHNLCSNITCSRHNLHSNITCSLYSNITCSLHHNLHSNITWSWHHNLISNMPEES